MNFRNSLIAVLCCGCFAVAPVAAIGGKPTGKGGRVDYAQLAVKRGMGTRLAATLLLNGGFPDKWLKRAGGATPPRSLDWPIPGRRLGRGFGSDDGRHLAVDITAPVGTPVRSMGAGVVGYADDTVKGYGNMVLVLHPGGWVTLYAHLDKFKVKPGQKVSRGQILASTGNTGISRGPHLHFALIIRGEPADPVPLIRNMPGKKHRLS